MFKSILNKLGYQIISKKKLENQFPQDFTRNHIEIYTKVAPYTMTSKERIFSVIEATKYIVKNNIAGDIVECGVWKGGSSMAILETLKQLNDIERKIYLYDTFEGMSAPTDADKTHSDKSAEDLLSANTDKEANLVWAFSPLEEVKQNIDQCGYPSQMVQFIKGKIEDTIPANMPGSIALLRLDTDWYESTKHELEHLYPLLVKGGVIIIDDYGYWEGARKAVDEYIVKEKLPLLLNRIDDTGRIAIKP